MQPLELSKRGISAFDRHAVGRVVIASEERTGLPQARRDDVERRTVDVAGDLLLEARDGGARLAHDFARVGAHRAVEQLHHGALPGSVPSEQAHALAPLDIKGRAVEDGWTAERHADILHSQQRHSYKLKAREGFMSLRRGFAVLLLVSAAMQRADAQNPPARLPAVVINATPDLP